MGAWRELFQAPIFPKYFAKNVENFCQKCWARTSGELKKADGVVEKISLLDGKFVIYVDGEAFSMDEIMEIKDKPAAEGSGENNETPPDETPPDKTPPDK